MIHGPSHSSEPVLGSLLIDIDPQRTALRSNCFLLDVDGDAAHERQIDDETVVNARAAGGGVPTATDDEGDFVSFYEAHGGADIGCRGDFDDAGLNAIRVESQKKKRD